MLHGEDGEEKHGRTYIINKKYQRRVIPSSIPPFPLVLSNP